MKDADYFLKFYAEERNMSFIQFINSRVKQSCNNSAFTLIEVMIAMVIFAIGILGVAKMQLNAINGNAKARKYSEASAFAQEQIELLMANSFANIAATIPVDPVPSDPDVYDSRSINGYNVRTKILNQADLDVDGNNDIMNIQVEVVDPSGIQRSLLTFSKVANL